MKQSELDSLYGGSALDTPIDAPPPSDSLSSEKVPNVFPRCNMPYRIAIIGEAPGSDETRSGTPFVGMSGRFLTDMLSKAGIIRDACFVGNIVQEQPPGNDIDSFSCDGRQFLEGLSQLDLDLKLFNPNVCLLLGKTALEQANGETAVSDWRGSFFLGTKGPFLGRKCIASFHPAACLRNYEWTPLLMFDIKKMFKESKTPLLVQPSRSLAIHLSCDEICDRLHLISTLKTPFATDIEGYVGDMNCISIATSPTDAFMIPFTNRGRSVWPLNEEVKIWRELAKVLSDPFIPKRLQNALYDTFVLQYSYNIIVRSVLDDTMLKSWELYCELEKSLGFLCSLYLHAQPFYKQDRKSPDIEVFWRYGCLDSAVTYEISDKLTPYLDPESRRHYQFNVALLNLFRYIEIRGIRYDSSLAQSRQETINQHIYSLQQRLDELSGRGIKPDLTRREMLELCQEVMCFKRDKDKPKKAYEDLYPYWHSIILSPAPFTLGQIGQFNIETKRSLNIKSQDFKDYLYDTLSLPVQYAKDPKTGDLHPSTNYESLLKLYKKSDHPSIPLAIEIGILRTRSQMLSIHSDPDKRIRCGYNIVGAETGRITCSTSPTGSGYNLQTIPSEDLLKPEGHPLRNGMRDLFLADPGMWLFQCDLSGADGWTVAAYLASLGDDTMLQDYLAGIKPAKVLCYMLRHGASSLSGRSRDEIKSLTKEVTKESWDYFACKIGQHMTCYRGGPRKLSDVILMQSEGKVVMPEKEVKDMQNLFFVRYRVKIWWDWAERFLSKQPYPPKVVSPSGHTRRFFGRKGKILGEFLAHLPQSITTYATNLAAYRLWTDPENSLGSPVQLKIEPLHQVHDALIGQFKLEDTSWAVDKIKSYFANEINIAGIKITIPFEGHYGPSWGEQTYNI